MSCKYDIHCKFDIEQHRKTYINYLEVMIKEDGEIVYAVPSHQEMASALACERLRVSKEELLAACPSEYYCDYMTWLLSISGAIAVWTGYCIAPHATKKQIRSLKRLKLAGLYKGPVPIISKNEGG